MVAENGRGIGTLKKLGAHCDAAMRQSFRRGEERMDQTLWSIGREGWTFASASCSRRVH